MPKSQNDFENVHGDELSLEAEQGVEEAHHKILDMLTSSHKPSPEAVEEVRKLLFTLSKEAREYLATNFGRYAKQKQKSKEVLPNKNLLVVLFRPKKEEIEELGHDEGIGEDERGYVDIFLEEVRAFVQMGEEADASVIDARIQDFKGFSAQAQQEIRTQLREIAKTNQTLYSSNPLYAGIIGKTVLRASKQKSPNTAKVGTARKNPLAEEDSFGILDQVQVEQELEGATAHTAEPIEPPEEKEGVSEPVEEQEVENTDSPEEIIDKPLIDVAELHTDTPEPKKIKHPASKDRKEIAPAVPKERKEIAPLISPIEKPEDIKTALHFLLHNKIKRDSIEGEFQKTYDTSVELFKRLSKDIEQKILAEKPVTKETLAECMDIIASLRELEQGLATLKYDKVSPTASAVKELVLAINREAADCRRYVQGLVEEETQVDVTKKADPKKPHAQKRAFAATTKKANPLHLLETMQNQEAIAAHLIGGAVTGLRDLETQDSSGGLGMIQDAVVAMKEVIELFNTKITKEQYGALISYFKKYVVNELILLKTKILTLKGTGIPYDPEDMAQKFDSLGSVPAVTAAIEGLSNEPEIVATLKELVADLDILWEIAVRKKIRLSLKDDENVISEKKSPADRVAAEKNKEATKPAEAAPTPQIPTIDQILPPRDPKNPIPPEIIADAGFSAWLESTLTAVRKKYTTIADPSTLPPIETYYATYKEQQPIIAELKARLDSKDFDNLFETFSDDEKPSAREQLLKDIQFRLFDTNEKLDDIPIVRAARKATEEIKRMRQSEEELETITQDILPTDGGGYVPEDVYKALGSTDQGSTARRLNELKQFAADMEKNYEFYRSASDAADANQKYRDMYRLYKRTHPEGGHRVKKIWWGAQIWAKITRGQGREEDNAGDIARFSANMQLMRKLWLVPPYNNKESRDTAAYNMEKLQSYFEIADQAIDNQQNPEDPKLFNPHDPRNSEAAIGQTKFKELFMPYTNSRAYDQDMQEQAEFLKAPTPDKVQNIQGGVTQRQQSTEMANKELSNAFKDQMVQTAFTERAKVSIAVAKLREVDQKLKNIQAHAPTDKRTYKGPSKKEEGIKNIIVAYEYAKSIVDRTDLAHISPEDLLYVKTVSVRFLEKVVTAKDVFTPELAGTIAKHVATYENIALDKDIPAAERTRFFDLLLRELQAKNTSTLSMLEKMNLESIIREFTNLKSKI